MAEDQLPARCRHSVYCILTIQCSLAVICVERGIYFFTTEVLGMGDLGNLCLALILGIGYVCGSLNSHRLASRIGERNLLAWTFGLQILGHGAMASAPGAVSVCLGVGVVSFLYGIQWPVIESYVSAGRSPREVQRAVGTFSLSWAVAVPISLALTSPIIALWKPGMFVLPAALNVVTLLMLRLIPKRPPHLPSSHPGRPSRAELTNLQRLLVSHRWLMVFSYVALFLLAPLLPRLLKDVGIATAWASGLSGLIDWMRASTFLVMCLFAGWHGKKGIVYCCLIMLPLGFYMILLGTSPILVLAGEVVFGIAMGAVYYGALHYALVISNAAVNAGGVHEALIGSGYAIGPTIGLISLGLAPTIGSSTGAYALTPLPLFAICLLLAIRSLRRRPATAGRPRRPERSAE